MRVLLKNILQVIILSSCLSFFQYHSVANSAEDSVRLSCEVVLDAIGTDQQKKYIDLSHLNFPDKKPKILSEKYTLYDYLLSDDETSLAVQSPLDFMNAAQRMLAMILSQGQHSMRIITTGDMVDYYPFFSDGLPITNGFRIVGNEKVLDHIVSNLRAQALGDRSGSSVILLVGGAATGKSEVFKILGTGFENYTFQDGLRTAIHTFDWVQLAKVPSLRKYLLTSADEKGNTVYQDVEAPLQDSPFTLFPEAIQGMLLERAQKYGKTMLQGMSLAPISLPDPISQFIRLEIIKHYSTERGHSLTPYEVVEVLNKHIRVKRHVMGPTFSNTPLIDVQGDNLDVPGLFMAPNPVVRFATGVGPTHVMAWYLNGKMLKGHGNAVFLDEFLRNKELRDMFLSAFQSRVLTIGGAPSVPFDTVLIAASNTANLEAVLNEGGTVQGGGGNPNQQRPGYASVSRLEQVPMRYTLFPNETAQVLLNDKQSVLWMQQIHPDPQTVNQPIVKGDLVKLYPRRTQLTRAETPDYRYRVWLGDGGERVYVSPHALELMSEIVTITRYDTSVERAQKVTLGKIINSRLFRDPLSRLQFYEGLYSEVTQEEISELVKVSGLLGEGETGMDPRAAGRWLKNAMAMAAKTPAKTLTLSIVMDALQRGLVEGFINVPNNKARLEWSSLADEVIAKMLVPRLNLDISNALANGDRVVRDSYFDIIDEILALSKNPSSRKYLSSKNGEQREIDFIRLAKVKENFEKKNGRKLNETQIAIFHFQQRLLTQEGQVPNESLLEAISMYYADLNTQLGGLDSVLEYDRTGNGGEEVQNVHSSLASALKSMGYNQASMSDALQIVRHARSQQEAP